MPHRHPSLSVALGGEVWGPGDALGGGGSQPGLKSPPPQGLPQSPPVASMVSRGRTPRARARTSRPPPSTTCRTSVRGSAGDTRPGVDAPLYRVAPDRGGGSPRTLCTTHRRSLLPPSSPENSALPSSGATSGSPLGTCPPPVVAVSGEGGTVTERLGPPGSHPSGGSRVVLCGRRDEGDPVLGGTHPRSYPGRSSPSSTVPELILGVSVTSGLIPGPGPLSSGG